MDYKRVAAWLGALLLSLLGWTLVDIVSDMQERIRYVRDVQVRHLEWHKERSSEQPSVWRSR